MDFAETDEQRMLRSSVATMARKYSHDYLWAKAKAGELWAEAGQAGFLGVAVPEQYGGGMIELAIVTEEIASAEAAINAVDASVQAHGGNGMSVEYGIGPLIGSVHTPRIAPVSREMTLTFVARHTLGLPRSY